MRKFSWIVTVAALALALVIAPSPAKDPKKADENLMRRKLTESQKVLEGIALNNFDKIGSGAEELIQISKLAEWKVLKDPQYELFSNEFRRRADQVARAAKDKNLDGATLGYVEMTMTCVRCHQHVREVRRSELDRPERDRSVAAE
jgi:hypothetical protein